ncbi:MAG: hypothetical protein NT105_03340 [Verrucomicrobia bacterium]|nr:hypothetical protein [Verrucomicrobiota bacterium]
MAILQSNNGQFYQVPDEEAEKFLVPADKVEETLRAAGAAQQPQHQQACCAPGAPAGGPMRLEASTVVIYVGGSGPPHVMQAGAGPQGQVQAYDGRRGHGGHHGGGGWGWWGFGTGLALGAAAASYNNYSNYQNYNNYGGGW